MGIQINGQTDTISAVDGALTVSGAELPTVTNLIAQQLNVSGVSTFTGNIVLSGANANIQFSDSAGGSESVIRSRYNLTLSADHLAEQGTLYSNLIFKTDGNERARVSADGNLGIGTDNPSNLIHLYSTSDGAELLQLEIGGQPANTEKGKIIWRATQTDGNSMKLASIGATAINNWGGEFQIFTKPANGTPNDTIVERVRVDNAGRVTMPYQPSFMVYADGGVSYGTGWRKMQFSSSYSGVSFNKSNFDFTNHRYTVPVAGKYLFSAALTFTGSTNTDGTITLAKNGSPEGGRSQSWASGTGLGGVDATYVLDMAASDYCEVQVYFGATNTTRNTQFAGYFSGYLIG